MHTQLIFLLFPLLFAQQDPEKQLTQKCFAAVFSTGSAWDTTKTFAQQKHAKLHSQNLKRLRDEGKLTIGGRFGEFGFILVKANDEAETRSFFASDSTVIEKIFNLKISQFNPFYKGSIE